MKKIYIKKGKLYISLPSLVKIYGGGMEICSYCGSPLDYDTNMYQYYCWCRDREQKCSLFELFSILFKGGWKIVKEVE